MCVWEVVSKEIGKERHYYEFQQWLQNRIYDPYVLILFSES